MPWDTSSTKCLIYKVNNKNKWPIIFPATSRHLFEHMNNKNTKIHFLTVQYLEKLSKSFFNNLWFQNKDKHWQFLSYALYLVFVCFWHFIFDQKKHFKFVNSLFYFRNFEATFKNTKSHFNLEMTFRKKPKKLPCKCSNGNFFHDF